MTLPTDPSQVQSPAAELMQALVSARDLLEQHQELFNPATVPVHLIGALDIGIDMLRRNEGAAEDATRTVLKLINGRTQKRRSPTEPRKR